MAIDFTTAVGQVRLLLNDVDEANLVFTTPEISAFLTIEGDSVKRAAAQAIDTNATNEALASKVIKDHQLSTDGAKVADAMRKHAAVLRAQADRDDDLSDDGAFVEYVPTFGQPCSPELAESPTWWP